MNQYLRIKALSFILIVSFGITGAQNAGNISELLQYVNLRYGTDQVLVNGQYSGDFYKNDIGHPFFRSDEFQPGSIRLHGTVYEVLCRYNDFNQQLELMHPDTKGNRIIFTPPVEFIDSFNIYGQSFVKHNFPKTGEAFFQVVYSKQLKCLYYWKKNRSESSHNVTFSAFKYYDDSRDMFLVIDGELIKYRSKRSFLKPFPKEERKNIARFMKTQNINVRKSLPADMAELMARCEQILDNKKLNL